MIEIEVGKSRYKIRCRPEEQDRLFALAKKLNERVNQIALSSREGEERTLLIMLALLLEDELEELKISKTELEPKLAEPKFPETLAENHSCKSCAEMFEILEDTASNLEGLANKIR